MTGDAELRALLADCLKLWATEGNVTAGEDGMRVQTGQGHCVVRSGAAPARWLVTAGGRTRAVPSVVALLSAVRRTVGVAPGVRARVGAGAGPA